MQNFGILALMVIQILFIATILGRSSEILTGNLQSIEEEFRKHQCGSLAALDANISEAFARVSDRYQQSSFPIPTGAEVIASELPALDADVECAAGDREIYQQNPRQDPGPNWHYRVSMH